MEQSIDNLSQFFGIKDIPKKELTQIVKSDEFKPVIEGVKKKLKGVTAPGFFYESMLKHISELLKIDLRAILLSAWSASDELTKFLDSKNYSEDEIVMIPLAEHTITSEHNPALKPSINQVPIAEIKFNIALEFVLKGVILNIQNGMITDVSLGSCGGKGSVKYKDSTILEKDMQLPDPFGPISLGKGIPLKDPSEAIHKRLEMILSEVPSLNKEIH
jgi:hypothetical protein